MNKLVEIIKSIYNIKELRDRIIFTLGLLLVYRLGAQVVLPGVDSLALSDLSSRSEGGGLLGILNAFTGGAFANASIFALGIMPYISASIVVQLMGVALPYLQKLSRRRIRRRRRAFFGSTRRFCGRASQCHSTGECACRCSLVRRTARTRGSSFAPRQRVTSNGRW